MPFGYNREKSSHSGDSFWTSYSDLFLGLSTIFLLLYVTASLRTGTDAIKAQVENQKLTMQVEELRSQLKMYEQIKSDYLQKSASKDEMDEYNELMDKLTLLKEEAKNDQEKLARQSLENERKAQALNKYQQMVRNMINANKVAKTKLITRNGIIDEQQQNISELENDVSEKKRQIETNERAIAQAEEALDQNRKKLLASLKSNQITRKQYEHRLQELQEQSDSKIESLQSKNNSLSSELKGTQATAARKEKEMQSKIIGLSGQLKDTEGALAKAKEEMDARREIAKEIKKGFAAAGVKADVDMQTGEVVLDFGENYFDSDSANLKPQMRQVIEKAMPVYSHSLFGNHKVANKISSVEIVGYASPTYKGRFVDPHSNKPEDKAALKYNMDLSYRRANSIFNYLVSNRNGEFEHQQDLMALMKVSGRSFLEVMKVQNRNPANAVEFCKVNDCKKAQKVIVRFSMDGKK